MSVIKAPNGTDINIDGEAGEVSDGYHSFNELYEHRIALFIFLMKSHPKMSWWSRLHADGEAWDGWVIAGMHLPSGDISYHLSDKYVHDFLETDDNITELDRAPEWDGHTSADVVKRIEAVTVLPCESEE